MKSHEVDQLSSYILNHLTCTNCATMSHELNATRSSTCPCPPHSGSVGAFAGQVALPTGAA